MFSEITKKAVPISGAPKQAARAPPITGAPQTNIRPPVVPGQPSMPPPMQPSNHPLFYLFDRFGEKSSKLILNRICQKSF